MTQVSRSRMPARRLVWVGAGLMALLSMSLAGCGAATYVNTQSYERQLAEHLEAEGAAMYGAFWCPHCASQKKLFGAAADAVPYVECDPEGKSAQPQLCQAKNIEGYPTWEIDGELYPGVRSLEELSQLSGFKVPEESAR